MPAGVGAVDCGAEQQEADERRHGICRNEDYKLGESAVARGKDGERRQRGRGSRQGHDEGDQTGRVIASGPLLSRTAKVRMGWPLARG